MPEQKTPGSLGVASINENNIKRAKTISPNSKSKNIIDFKIVAIGASIGGLKAIKEVLENPNIPTNMAYIFVQHLEPNRESLLVGLIGKNTKLKVLLAAEAMIIEAGNVYIIPAGVFLSVNNNAFHLDRPQKLDDKENAQIRLPFDILLNSFAIEFGNRMIAIILSGGGNDGSVGIVAIKENGGFIIAQTPDDAEDAGMPNAAIATKLVDEICTAKSIGDYLQDLPKAKPPIIKNAPNPIPKVDNKEENLNEVIGLLKTYNAHDFTQYKLGTLQRRIEWRMSMIGIIEIKSYIAQLHIDAEEREKLCDDLLINVTSFFRDEEVFKDLRKDIIAQLVRDCPKDLILRIWVAGCSSGEEAYSLAILFNEEMESQKHIIKIQIFASDLDTQAIAMARDGQYSASIKTQVSSERLKKYFLEDGQGFRVTPQLRSQIIFTVHNVLSDPPFSNIDFVSCRNLLIYLTPIAQAKIISRFHFALKDNGLLLLGKAETAGHIIGRFEIISKTFRIYRRIGQHEWNENSFSSKLGIRANETYKVGNGLEAKNHLKDLKQELEDTKVQLLGAMHNLEISDEVQKTVNEEALSVNEEYQSANEELITSKEELQALNEELSALNSQLQDALDVQRVLSNDLQNVLYSTDIATLFLDKEFQIRFFTPATRSIFNIIASDIGRPLSDLSSLAQDPSLVKDLSGVLNGDNKHEREVRTNDGKWYMRRVHPYLNDKTTIEGVVITFSDITERKHTSKALEEARLEADRANLAKSRFLAVASHDLRQPLQSLALLQGLLANLVDTPEANKIVQRLNETLDSITSMLNSLLDLNQIESGLIKVSKTDFCIDDLLQRLYDEFNFHARAQNLQLHYVKSSRLVNSDMRLLEQIIRNLISNAFKYTPNGKVLIGCRVEKGFLKIKILDTGIGIEKNNLESIFEAYNQVNNPTKSGTRGLGLGLSIVQRLSQLLNHKVSVSSKLYRGSVFSIEVPLAKAELSTLVKSEITANKNLITRPIHIENPMILVIEDDADVRDLLLQLLEAKGFDAVAFKNGSDAFDWVERAKTTPNLILADYNLSHELNGVDSSLRIRKQCKFHIPVVILTGDTSNETLHNIAANDCVQLNKPVKLSELTNAINEKLGFIPYNSKSNKASEPSKEKIADKIKHNPNDKNSLEWIYIIDDDAFIRLAMRQTFEAKNYNVKDFSDAEQFLKSDYAKNANCILIDAYLPHLSGIEVLKELQNANVSIPAIMITGNADVNMSVSAMKSGAIDFLEKPVKPDDLINRVEHAIECCRDLNKLNDWKNNAAEIISKLTPRQKEIMQAVLDGKPSKIIAFEFNISQRTVENHRALIMKKTNTKSLPELARLAIMAQ